jgi:hypothetical protein
VRLALCLIAVGVSLWAGVRWLRQPSPPHGSVELNLRFPRWPVAEAEPLVESGSLATGADCLYVIYGDKTVQFGVVHLNGAAILSPPLPVVRGRTYTLRYESTALQTAPTATGKGHVRLEFEGHILIDQDIGTSPSTPDNLWIGRNPVAINVCAPRFTGWIKRVP